MNLPQIAQKTQIFKTNTNFSNNTNLGAPIRCLVRSNTERKEYTEKIRSIREISVQKEKKNIRVFRVIRVQKNRIRNEIQ